MKERKVFSVPEAGLVSIIIPTYNYGRYLRPCIESALKQTYPKVEIIVVDDGSTDDTAKIVADYPVKYLFQRNQGTSVAMNNGIKLSRGEFFFTIGSDDMLGKQYVSKTLEQILRDKHIGLVYTGVAHFGESKGVVLPRKLYHRFSILVGGWIGIIGCALTRRKAYESVGGFDPLLQAYEGLDFVTRLCLKGWKVKAIFEPLYFGRQHQTEFAHRHPAGVDLIKDRNILAQIDRKFWYRQLYLRMLFAYSLFFERFFFLFQNPVAYLSGLRKEYRIKSIARSYRSGSPTNREKVLELSSLQLQEIHDLVSAQVAREPLLVRFHKRQLAKIESDFSQLVLKDIGTKKNRRRL